MILAAKEWYQIAKYDLETAKAMFKTKRYLYVVFMCQQALEKLLKACYVKKNNQLPPRIHHLNRLVKLIKINLPPAQLKLLTFLNQYYLESRYPDEREKLAKALSKRLAKNFLEETKKIWQTIEKKSKLKK